MSRLTELIERREALRAASAGLRAELARDSAVLTGPARVVDRVVAVVLRLRALPIGLVAGLARQTVGEAIGSPRGRARLYSGLAAGAAVLIRRWRRRRRAAKEGETGP